jgi:outer membrane biogenesis lipoprotein LolB
MPTSPKRSDHSGPRKSQEEMFEELFKFVGMRPPVAQSEDWVQGPFWATRTDPILWEEEDGV